MGKRNTGEPIEGTAVVLEDSNGKVKTYLPGDKEYSSLVAAVASELEFNSPYFAPLGVRTQSAARRLSPYQLFIQNARPGLRDILVPSHTDFDEIVSRAIWYSNTNHWVSRALSLRAALNAAEFSLFVPNNDKQLDWLTDLCRELKMYSVVREIFWNLRAFDQCVILWKTVPGGTKPISIECQDLRVVKPMGPGHTPRLVMYPHKDKALANAASLDGRRKDTKQATSAYPPVLLEAARKQAPVPVEMLEPYGYHFEYVARNRRDWDDTAFPTMYSIFADLELIALAAEIDANALHHYKAGILQFAVGPENPSNIEVIPGGTVLKTTETEVKKQLNNRLSTLFTRGDVHIRWVVPPKDILTEEKYTSALRRVFDYLGFPKIAWAGQAADGAFAAAVSALKFLRAESNDDRTLVKEFLESFFTKRSEASNQFSDSENVRVRFDPNALVEDSVITELMRLFMQSGGASTQTILEMADLDPEFEASQRKRLKEMKKKFGIDFAPEFSPAKAKPNGSARPGQRMNNEGGAPRIGENPRSEEMTGRQPRATAGMVEAIAARLGVSPDEIIAAIRDVEVGDTDEQ